jgi:hypothetical protein
MARTLQMGEVPALIAPPAVTGGIHRGCALRTGGDHLVTTLQRAMVSR